LRPSNFSWKVRFGGGRAEAALRVGMAVGISELRVGMAAGVEDEAAIEK
jgi:hypothetical protein